MVYFWYTTEDDIACSCDVPTPYFLRHYKMPDCPVHSPRKSKTQDIQMASLPAVWRYNGQPFSKAVRSNISGVKSTVFVAFGFPNVHLVKLPTDYTYWLKHVHSSVAPRDCKTCNESLVLIFQIATLWKCMTYATSKYDCASGRPCALLPSTSFLRYVPYQNARDQGDWGGYVLPVTNNPFLAISIYPATMVYRKIN